MDTLYSAITKLLPSPSYFYCTENMLSLPPKSPKVKYEIIYTFSL